eukprot:6466808-Amphidinium_carterae.4
MLACHGHGSTNLIKHVKLLGACLGLQGQELGRFLSVMGLAVMMCSHSFVATGFQKVDITWKAVSNDSSYSSSTVAISALSVIVAIV